MSIFKRVAKIVEANVEDAKEKRKDPADDVQAVYQNMISQASEVKRLIGELELNAERAGNERAAAEQRADDLRKEAEEAVAAGDEDRARQLLQRRRGELDKAEQHKAREQALKKRIAQLKDAQQQLREQIHAFADRRDDVDARMSGAEAQLALQSAQAAVSGSSAAALEKEEQMAREAEAKAQLHESVDDELERLLRDSAK
jgi:phage shock protein A